MQCLLHKALPRPAAPRGLRQPLLILLSGGVSDRGRPGGPAALGAPRASWAPLGRRYSGTRYNTTPARISIISYQISPNPGLYRPYFIGCICSGMYLPTRPTGRLRSIAACQCEAPASSARHSSRRGAKRRPRREQWQSSHGKQGARDVGGVGARPQAAKRRCVPYTGGGSCGRAVPGRVSGHRLRR